MSILKTAKQTWIGLRKTAGDVVDLFAPKNQVEARLIHATGPHKGSIYKTYQGRNVITSWQSSDGSSPTSGRDLMRRLIAPPTAGGVTVAGSLSGYDSTGTDTGSYVSKMGLGSGTSAEAATDKTLDSAISSGAGGESSISEVEFDGSDTYVTFVCNWSESEANTTIGEVSLLSGRDDFLGRKTFSSFAKTDEFTLQIRWTLRF